MTPGGEKRKRRATQAQMENCLKSVPKTLCLDLIDLTVCYRYMESLLANPRIRRYLKKHHAQQLTEMENLVVEVAGFAR